MHIEYKEILTSRYPISCKLYRSEKAAEGIILGVHGFAGDKESSALYALADAATHKGVELLCFDLPAHGGSETTEADFTVRNCLNDILYMADVCREEYPNAKKYLFATSFGGYLTLLCCTELQDFRIVLRAPAVTMPEHILTDLLKTTPEEFRRRGRIECGFERKIELPWQFYEELQCCRIQDCSCVEPVLVIHGDADDVVPHNDILDFCKEHPNTKLCVIHGADHRFKKSGEIERVICAAMEYWKL